MRKGAFFWFCLVKRWFCIGKPTFPILFILKGFLLICNRVLVIFSGVAYKFLLMVGPSSFKRFLLICKRVLRNFSGVPHNLKRILIHHNKVKRNINRIPI